VKCHAANTPFIQLDELSSFPLEGFLIVVDKEHTAVEFDYPSRTIFVPHDIDGELVMGALKVLPIFPFSGTFIVG